MHHLTATQLHNRFNDGVHSAVEIATYFLDRIEKLNPELGAFISFDREKVIDQAKRIDSKKASGLQLGKLAAIPVAIKDNIHIKGQVTSCASNMMKEYVAPFDSTVVKLLKYEDAIIIGKTNLDEFAMGSSNETSAFFNCKNPLDTTRTPGGSSGGSAAAVAAGLCMIALGTDTGGSIRQPAAFTGSVGFKPSYGMVSRYGLVAFASSLDQIGPIAKTTEDVELAMKVLAKHCSKDAMSYENAQAAIEEEHIVSKPLHIIIPDHFPQEIKTGVLEMFSKQVERLRNAGHTIEKRNLSVFDHAVSVYYILAPAEASSNLSRFDGMNFTSRKPAKTLDGVYKKSRQSFLGKEVQRRILLGTYVLSSKHYQSHFQKAQKARRLIVEELHTTLSSCDMIMTPSVPTLPFKLGASMTPIQMYTQDVFAIPANLAGLPAISLPVQTTSTLPGGIQCIGKQFQDSLLLTHAQTVQQSIDTYSYTFDERPI